jgi:hypothetical protein
MNSFSNPFAYADPRLIAAAHAEAAARNRRRGPPQQGEEANEVASFLLQLKHRNATEAQLAEIAAQEDVERRMLFQQAQLRAAVAHSQGYPSMGPIYGLPAGMDLRQSFMERAGAQPVHTSSHLEEPVVSEISWEHLLGDSKLVYMKDRDLVPDALFVVMAQMKACKLTQADRVGCYKNREIGFVGMCCKHCGGQPGFGRYYPNSVRSLAQTTTSQTILKHIGSKCRFCPPHLRQAVLELQRQQAAKEGIAAGRPRYGSRKIFFQRIWARLHGSKTDEFETDDDEDSKIGQENSDGEDSSNNAERSQTTPVQKRKAEEEIAGKDGPDAKKACV